MLGNINIENILFLDIETVPQFPDYDSTPDGIRALWDLKANLLKKNPEFELESALSLYRRAGIYAEFGKIICISVGYIKGNEFRAKSFFGHGETELLQ